MSKAEQTDEAGGGLDPSRLNQAEIAAYRSALTDALGRPISISGEIRVWLDDDLVQRSAPAGWVHVRTAREACLLILSGRVIQLSLDNDLGDSYRREADGSISEEEGLARLPGSVEFGSGYQVVEFIKEISAINQLKLWPRDGISVHSANPTERDAIVRSLLALERDPKIRVRRVLCSGQPQLFVEEIA